MESKAVECRFWRKIRCAIAACGWSPLAAAQGFPRCSRDSSASFFLPRKFPARFPTRRSSAILCAVVTVSDDGGSSGRLRKELNMLPPGDIRNCIVALSEDEALLSRLFRHRFDKGSGLEGHSFGNLFLAALTSITRTFPKPSDCRQKFCSPADTSIPRPPPISNSKRLMEDGTRVRGETKITASKGRIHELFLVPPDVEPMPQTLEAIAHADMITIGPGSLFTSLIPNLLVRGISQAIVASPATKVYICNLMTQANESLGLSAADHIRALHRHAHDQGRLFDYALINRTAVSEELKAKYETEGGRQIVADLEAIEAMGVIPVLGDYLEEDGVARHNTARVARDLMQLATEQRSSDVPKPRARWHSRATDGNYCKSRHPERSRSQFTTCLSASEDLSLDKLSAEPLHTDYPTSLSIPRHSCIVTLPTSIRLRSNMRTAILALSMFCLTSVRSPIRPRKRRPGNPTLERRGHSVPGGTDAHRSFNAGLRYGWVLTDSHLPSILRGKFEYAVDAVPLFLVFQPANTAYGVGFDPLGLKWNLQRHGRFSPYIELCGGVLFTTHNVPVGTNQVNFTDQAAFGTHILGAKYNWSLELRYMHISNAGLASPIQE